MTLTKYKLIHVPKGGVDHLLDGRRVRIDYQLTNDQADRLKAAGLPYFKKVSSPKPPETSGKVKSTTGQRSGRKGAERPAQPTSNPASPGTDQQPASHF